MNICFTLSSLSAGGAERVAVSLANHFSRCGHKVSIVLVSINYNNSFYDIDDEVQVIPLLKTQKDKRIIRRVKLLRNCVLKINPDVVISFLPHICIYTHFALRRTKIPYICSERNDPNQYPVVYKILLRHAFKKANGCVFQTNDARHFYKMVKDEKAIIIHNPVFINLSKNAVKKDKKDKIFLSVGRLTSQKNFSLLINAFADVHNVFSDYKLIIYGEGNLRKDLEKLVVDLKLNDCVFLPGTNPNWHDVALNATGFVSSSNYEGMPNCLEEALCLGCPSIATDCPIGGSRELISLLHSGLLIDTNNKEQMASEMCKLITESNKQKSINSQPLEIDSISNKWIDFISNIIKNNR